MPALSLAGCAEIVPSHRVPFVRDVSHHRTFPLPFCSIRTGIPPFEGSALSFNRFANPKCVAQR